MPVKLTSPLSDIQKYMQQQLKRQERALVNTLMYIGTQCVNRARESNGYKDQTGNLRSSIGYIVAVNGRVRSASDFQPVGGSVGNGEQGSICGSHGARCDNECRT